MTASAIISYIFKHQPTYEMSKPLLLVVSISFLLCSCFRSSKTYFKDLLGFSATADVKHLNSYSDELGIDASYWMAFECNDSTVDKIIKKLQLSKSDVETRGLYGGMNSRPERWWDTSFVFHTKPFYREDDRIFWYLWYNKPQKKVYFLSFDL